ncbi:putative barnase/colicin E5 family endoribonuclease, partial [Helicobacter bizzozeronii]
MLNLKLKNNATKALIREIEGGLPPDDGGGGIANPKDTPISGEGNNKPPKGNDGHMGKEGNGSGSGGETRPYVVIEKQEDKEVFIKNLDLSASATPIPASLDVEGFLKTLEGVKNHKNFIEHLAQKKDGQSRLAYLNLVEPTLKSPNIELVFNDPARKKYIKAFKDEKGKTLKYLLITADNNETLITGLPVRQISYLQKQIRDADIIHSFIPPGRLANEQGALTPSGLPTAEFTTPELKNQATELHAKAKEQEAGFKQLLESLSQPSSTLEASNILKSVGSIQSKLERKQGRTESLNDLLRGAIIAKDREVIDDQLAQIAIKLRDAQIPHTIEYKENRGSGYEGIHIHFKHNDVSAEIQVHTPKNWAIKKQQDEKYHIIREEEINPTLGEEELKKLKEESKALGQDSDLDIKLLTSFEVISTESTSAKSLNRLNADTDSNLTHILRLKSNSKEPPPSKDANAYKRPDSELNQNDNLSSGSGNIITPLEKNTKPPLKTPNIEPNPAFGEHFKEFEGKGAQAVAKLLQEKRGQVAGAFYREDLGYIDLVWGDSKKGLAHILERRTQQYGEQQALEFIHNLPRILQEAKFWREIEDKIELVTPTDMIVLGKRDNNKFVLTSFKDRRSKDRFVELENPQTGDDVGFTGKSVSEPQTKDDVLLPNQTNSTTTPLKPKKSKTPPLEIEGEHYFGHDNAHPQFKGFYGVLRLFKDKDHGEISRAFTRPDLGDIDLVWGKQKGLKGGKVVDIGLSR